MPRQKKKPEIVVQEEIAEFSENFADPVEKDLAMEAVSDLLNGITSRPIRRVFEHAIENLKSLSEPKSVRDAA